MSFKHTPLSRSDEPWIAHPGETFNIGDVKAYFFTKWCPDDKTRLKAIVTHEPIGRTRKLWHVSISHPNRYPTWDEQVDALRQLGPKHITWEMILPPDGDGYVNLHGTTFHWMEREE